MNLPCSTIAIFGARYRDVASWGSYCNVVEEPNEAPGALWAGGAGGWVNTEAEKKKHASRLFVRKETHPMPETITWPAAPVQDATMHLRDVL